MFKHSILVAILIVSVSSLSFAMGFTPPPVPTTTPTSQPIQVSSSQTMTKQQVNNYNAKLARDFLDGKISSDEYDDKFMY